MAAAIEPAVTGPPEARREPLDLHERLTVRPIRPDDADRMVAFHEALDDETHYLRFFNAHPHLSTEEVTHFTQVDHDEREALVVLEGDRVVAVGRYDRVHADPTTAEVAFVVAPEHRGEGIASWLLRELARRARQAGFVTFLGETLTTNKRMRSVFRESGFAQTAAYDGTIVETRMDIRDA